MHFGCYTHQISSYMNSEKLRSHNVCKCALKPSSKTSLCVQMWHGWELQRAFFLHDLPLCLKSVQNCTSQVWFPSGLVALSHAGLMDTQKTHGEAVLCSQWDSISCWHGCNSRISPFLGWPGRTALEHVSRNHIAKQSISRIVQWAGEGVVQRKYSS